MDFGTIPSREATGAILAHTVKAGSRTLKKGRVLSADDVDLLDGEGIEHVIGARLGTEDVHEDEAAAEAASAIMGAHADLAEAFTGRANIYAKNRASR